MTQTNINLAQSAFLSKPISQQPTSQVPQFYFPKGKPVDNVTKATTRSQINAIIGEQPQISEEALKKLIGDVLGLPHYFSVLAVLRATGKTDVRTLKKTEFQEIWKELQNKEIHFRAFYLLSGDKKKKFCTPQDFKILFKEILETHPGLQFLKDTPDFQDWYSLCVIHRMFYMANRKGDYKLTFRQFKKSKILRALFDIETEPDINRNPDFFSYEDFYVIYIKFWQLDSDHDFFLQKQELSKYSGYTLSRKTVERIFAQCARKFREPNKMTFGDFVWFILAVEDKTTEQSVEYWFRIMDLDGNGIVTGYELEYFYEEQNQRLAYMDSTLDFNFQNIVCQMVDLLRPSNHIQFTLQNFLAKRQQASVFINMLTDLNKLVGYEQRDAYEQRTLKQQNPGWTQWDRFVKPEYKRIESTTEDDNNEVLNWENDD